MTKRTYILSAIATVTMLGACKKDQYYLYNDTARIQFGSDPSFLYRPAYDMNDTVKPHTFYYDDATITQDTVFFDIYAIGGTSSNDRRFELAQEEIPGQLNAVPDVHYKAFNDKGLEGSYIMPAGKVHTRVPIVVLRDASLKTSTVKLKVVVKANDTFQPGESKKLWRRVELTDALSRPAAWDRGGELYYWGKYSVVKHTFMIEQTGEKWDEAFIRSFEVDLTLFSFWNVSLKTKLILYNAAHPGAPLTDENGDLVTFP